MNLVTAKVKTVKQINADGMFPQYQMKKVLDFGDIHRCRPKGLHGGEVYPLFLPSSFARNILDRAIIPLARSCATCPQLNNRRD